MDMERAIETQRLRLLRVVAGLVVAVGVLSVGPVARLFGLGLGLVGSILSRAEVATRYLVLAQARRMAARHGNSVDWSQFSKSLSHVFDAPETEVSVSDCRARLRALRAVLMDLPRHALRLLRRIEDQMRGAAGAGPHLPRADERRSARIQGWRLAGNRIERPPDQTELLSASPSFLSPSGFRTGAADGWIDH